MDPLRLDGRKIGQQRVGQETGDGLVAGRDEEYALALDRLGEVLVGDEGEVGALLPAGLETGWGVDDCEPHGLEQFGVRALPLADRLVLPAGAVERDDRDVAVRRLDLRLGVPDVLVEVGRHLLGLGFQTGRLAQLDGQFPPVLLGVVHDDGGKASRDLRVVVGDRVGAGGRYDHEVGFGRDDGLHVELEVPVEGLDAPPVGDFGPLGEEALRIGDGGGGGRGGGDEWCVDGQQAPGDARRRRDDSLGLALQLGGALFVLDLAGPSPGRSAGGLRTARRCAVAARRTGYGEHGSQRDDAGCQDA